tara:strand:- start:105 stop:1325 length:1221 start_codon:yes stop_codon:yes gene_type:complete
MPFSSSGVGIQTRLFIESLLATGEYEVVSIGGSTHHKDYTPFITEKYKEDWKIFPVKGFGSKEMVRSLIATQKPDALWLMTDPRFFQWLWEMDNEIRSSLPIVYYHVWDNYPYPKYNIPGYRSNDAIVCISKLTHDIVSTIVPDVKNYYLPHVVDTDVFKPMSKSRVYAFLEHNNIDPSSKKIFFWNNRNARRKQPGSLMWWFKEFLDEVGHDKAMLIMHTDPTDPHGPDLVKNLEHLELTEGQVFLSNNKLPETMLASFYNMADCTINIADAEGFGLSSLESMSCGTPLISTMTGGLQDQIFNGKEWFGIGIEPSAKAIIGSQEVPYIYEDRISSQDFKNACKDILEKPRSELEAWGLRARENVIENFSVKRYQEEWPRIMKEVLDENGSWSERRGFKSWSLEQI